MTSFISAKQAEGLEGKVVKTIDNCGDGIRIIFDDDTVLDCYGLRSVDIYKKS